MKLKEVFKKIGQNKLLMLITVVIAVGFVIIALYLIYYLVFIYPENQVSQLGITNVTEKANLINQYRTASIQLVSTSAQILGGITILIGLYFAWRNLEVALATLESNMKNAQENLKVAQESQITERFTRAIDQLGNQAIEIRLGGIYALERIANESESECWPIMEILTAYVKKNSSAEIVENKKITSLSMDIRSNKNITRDALETMKVSLDIQAALKVIGRRKYSFDNTGPATLNLKGVNFCGADLRVASLEWADLQGAHFEWADLQGAHLLVASLEGAILKEANLERVNLEEANLEEADLEGAHLKWANLKWANLKRANLKRANLEEAIFEKTNLKGAKYLTFDQLSKVKTLYKAELDEGLEEELRAKGFGHLLDVMTNLKNQNNEQDRITDT